MQQAVRSRAMKKLNALVNDQDECAALVHKSLPDDLSLRKVFTDCMRPRQLSELLMFGD